ncbi:hypothetical protein Q1695_012510 [Nippostrongylus brasiliensis]|nr:hypothetical protein Q1695_012510 [Nippostrongylus brasiliensis]
MTVTYTFSVANSTFFSFHRLLFKWKGSVWQAVWADVLVWCALYGALSVMYRVFLVDHHKLIFEDICIFFEQHASFIPVTFMLGFYVSAVYNRWWQVYENIGWIDQPSLQITQAIRGDDERSKMLRRTCIRYLVMVEALVFRDISPLVRRRFPTMNHFVTSGIMTARELDEFEGVSSPHAKYWLPFQWVLSLITLARDENRIKGEVIYVSLFDRIAGYRQKLINLVLYDWVPVPLVYTQVVHLTVYSYFLIALLGRQILDRDAVRKSIDLYVPIMTILQFTFFIGWLKVAEVLLNPLGEDADDFECNYIIDRNLQVGFSVEECYDNYPPLDRDVFWTSPIPEPLYTAESAMRPVHPQVGSCVDMPLLTQEAQFMLRPRRQTIGFGSHTSVWDGHVDNTLVVPVPGANGHNGLSNLSSAMATGGSSTSLKSLVKKIHRGSRRLSAIVFGRRSPAPDVRNMANSEAFSTTSSCDCGSVSIPISSGGYHTPPIFRDKVPSPLEGLDTAVCCEKLKNKRHSAPDLYVAPVTQRHDSIGSRALPVIQEEKDKPQSQKSSEQDFSVHVDQQAESSGGQSSSTATTQHERAV